MSLTSNAPVFALNEFPPSDLSLLNHEQQAPRIHPCQAHLRTITESLAERGYVVIDQALPTSLARALQQRVLALKANDALAEAGIGRGDDHQQVRAVRQDKIHWLDRQHAAEQGWASAMEKLRLMLNRELMMGLFSYESHFAHYAPGQAYQIHRDAFRGQQNRLVSTVLYLNEEWSATDGGELVLYNDDGQRLEQVLPAFNRLVVFLSEEFPHEVRPGHRDRHSIAGWFRVNGSRTHRVDPPR